VKRDLTRTHDEIARVTGRRARGLRFITVPSSSRWACQPARVFRLVPRDRTALCDDRIHAHDVAGVGGVTSMTATTSNVPATCERRGTTRHVGGGNAVYGLGLIGALVYYIQAADSFGGGVVGVLKAIVWPAFVVYDLLKFLAG